jgi:hypothetical protein
MGKILSVAVLCVALLFSLTSLQAHHSFSGEFDAQKPVKLRGLITKVEWINPHTWIHIDVKEPNGQVTKWEIELGTPNTLFRRGVTKNSLTTDTEILVDGYRARDGANRANGSKVTLTDGRQLLLGSPGDDAGKK